MKLFELFVFFTIMIGVFSQNLEESCPMPEDIPASRLIRLHHPCESNQNRDFAIVATNDFYCIFYSTLEISLFGAESKFEIKIEGEWDHDQVRRSF
jgi:hypothetical protein